MSKQSSLMILADRIASKIVAEQTHARLAIGFDAAIISAHEVFRLGPGRAGAYEDAYNKALNDLADLYISDCDENKDEKLDYAKGTRDAIIKKIVGPERFVPFDKVYGNAYIDELKRIRLIQKCKPKKMKHDVSDDLCPHCGMILRGYEGLKTCYCKFCGGEIER